MPLNFLTCEIIAKLSRFICEIVKVSRPSLSHHRFVSPTQFLIDNTKLNFRNLKNKNGDYHLLINTPPSGGFKPKNLQYFTFSRLLVFPETQNYSFLFKGRTFWDGASETRSTS